MTSSFAEPTPPSHHQDRFGQSRELLDLLPDVACRGAEKAFVAFAEPVTEAWKDERRREALQR